MVAEHNVSADMARSVGDVPRQPTLTEELDQAEREAKVTKALQAVDARHKSHGMKEEGRDCFASILPQL